MDFQSIRKEYEMQGLRRSDLSGDPLADLKTWYERAVECCPGDWFEPNAMTLATASSTGDVTARIVLLKGITNRGIKFYTNYESSKGRQMADNPSIAVVFHWPYLGRQIRITGTVQRTSRADSDEYFHARPRGSQISAAISSQSELIADRESLEALAKQQSDKIGKGDVPLPDFWGGYELVADQFEFWQGRVDRLHDRLVYRQATNTDPATGDSAGWTLDRLAP